MCFYKIFVFLFLLLQITLSIAQTNEVVGVSISEDTLAPHSSAILDVRSINKGVKFPTLSWEEIELWRDELKQNTNDISEKSNGLVVFVNDKSGASNEDLFLVRGFYYWKYEVSTGGDWVKLASRTAIYPPGAVIAYSGELTNLFNTGVGIPGTKMEGWAICDGRNGTPDLRARFVTSFSDIALGLPADKAVEGYELVDYGATQDKMYDENGEQNSLAGSQKVNNSDFHFVSKEQIPEHNHSSNVDEIEKDFSQGLKSISGDFLTHTHELEINEPHHHHKYNYTRREYDENRNNEKVQSVDGEEDYYKTIKRWKYTTIYTNENNEPKKGEFSKEFLGEYTGTKTTLADIDMHITKATSSFPHLEDDNISLNGDLQEPIDVRPTYYVVLYLMKL